MKSRGYLSARGHIRVEINREESMVISPAYRSNIVLSAERPTLIVVTQIGAAPTTVKFILRKGSTDISSVLLSDNL